MYLGLVVVKASSILEAFWLAQRFDETYTGTTKSGDGRPTLVGHNDITHHISDDSQNIIPTEIGCHRKSSKNIKERFETNIFGCKSHN